MISDYLPDIKGLIIDMDGVLWRDTEPIGDLVTIFNRISSLGLKSILATNNSSKTVAEYRNKLVGFGVNLEEWQIINSAQAVGIYLSEHFPQGTKIHVVGQPSLKDTLTSYGMSVFDQKETDVSVVVASIDFNLTYQKLKHASMLIQDGRAFIGTNPDRTYPTPEGFAPGSGTIIGALEIASGKKAKLIGKPEPFLYQMALKRLSLEPGETLAIGDRLETDIAGGQAAGTKTALVLTGVSSREQAENFQPRPDIIADNLMELIL